MTKFVVIAGAKGGVGRTTTALNLGLALQEFGRNVLVLDANLRTPTIVLHLGHPLVQTTLHDVLKGKKNIKQVAKVHTSGLRVIPAGFPLENIKDLDVSKLPEAIISLKDTAEIVLIDSAASIGDEFLAALHHADEVLVITTPDLPAVANALKTIKISEEHGKHILGVVINDVRAQDYELTVDNVQSLLGKPVIAVIPYDSAVPRSIPQKHPVVHTAPDAPSSIAFKKLAAALIGEKYVAHIDKEENKSLKKYLMKRLGFTKG